MAVGAPLTGLRGALVGMVGVVVAGVEGVVGEVGELEGEVCAQEGTISVKAHNKKRNRARLHNGSCMEKADSFDVR